VTDKIKSFEASAAIIRLVPVVHHAVQVPRPLHGLVTILGSGDGADLILASTKVESAHAAIIRLGRSAYLCDLGGVGGTTVNERRFRWVRLADGDTLGVGPFYFRVELEESAEFAGLEEPVFTLRNDGVIGAVSSIDPALLVGSDPACDVVIRHSAVAPRHCLVVWTDEGPVVRDLQRREQTRINGSKVNLGRLVNGDSIGVGPYELLFETPVGVVGESTSAASGPVAGLRPDTGVLLAGRLPAEQIPDLGSIIGEAAIPPSSLADKKMFRATAHSRGHQADEAGAGSAGSDRPRQKGRDGSLVRHKAQDATDHAVHNQGEDLMSAVEPAAGGVADEKELRLQRKYAELRSRVAAAQRALDERARKLRQGLDEEREYLRRCRDDLHKQAEKLLEVARGRPDGDLGNRSDADGGSGRGLVDLEIEEMMERKSPGAAGPTNGSGREDLTSGRSATAFGSNARGQQNTLHQYAGELAETVRAGREQIERAERRLESLRQDINRLRKHLALARQQHQTRDTELEARLAALERDQDLLRAEREKLLARMRTLNAQEAALQRHIQEAERSRQELEREAQELNAVQQSLDDRQRALRTSIEEESRRMRAHRAELKRKTAELARATREKRCSIEAEIAEKQAELALREAELQARRQAIEEAGRSELEKTNSELEQVLSIGLDEIEAELSARQAELESQTKALFDDPAFDAGTPDGWFDNAAGLQPSGAQPVGGPADSASPLPERPSPSCQPGGGGRLDVLVREVEALQKALSAMDHRTTAAFRNSTEEVPSLNLSRRPESRTSRLGGLSVAQLREKNATLRGAPEHTSDPASVALQAVEGDATLGDDFGEDAV